MIIEKPPEQLSREDIFRQALETAAQLLEKHEGNKLYKAAWKTGARLIRQLKP